MVRRHESMVGCQQAATDHGGAAVKRRDGGDASVMKSVNPGSPDWWSVSGQRNPVGRVASRNARDGHASHVFVFGFWLLPMTMTDVPDV